MRLGVDLERRAGESCVLWCGCLKMSGSVDAATDEDAWLTHAARGWAVYRCAAPRRVVALRLLDFLVVHTPWATLVLWG